MKSRSAIPHRKSVSVGIVSGPLDFLVRVCVPSVFSRVFRSWGVMCGWLRLSCSGWCGVWVVRGIVVRLRSGKWFSLGFGNVSWDSLVRVVVLQCVFPGLSFVSGGVVGFVCVVRVGVGFGWFGARVSCDSGGPIAFARGFSRLCGGYVSGGCLEGERSPAARSHSETRFRWGS